MNRPPHAGTVCALALAVAVLGAAVGLTPGARGAGEATNGTQAATRPAVPAAAEPAAAGARRESDRLAVDLPAAPAPTPPAASPAPAATGEPAPADPETVARELGVEAPAAPPGVFDPGAAAPAAGVEAGALEIRKKHPTTGFVSVGVGSNDSYHVGVGVTTQLSPRTSLSAAVSTGRWDEGWGWWSRDPFPPYRSFPELQP